MTGERRPCSSVEDLRSAPAPASILRFRSVAGIVVRRRVLGSGLAFADVAVAEADGNSGLETTKIVEAIFERRSFLRSDNEVRNGTQSQSCIVDGANVNSTSSLGLHDEPFPRKISRLPFGARVSLLVHDSDSDSAPGDSKDSNGNARHLRVAAWKIVEHPREEAESSAAIRIRPAGATGDTVTQRGGAVSCSTYLRLRQEDFVRSDETYRAAVVAAAATSTTTTTTTTTGQRSLLNKNNNNDNNSGHGDKRAGRLRAKIFAEWIIDEFGVDHLRGEAVDAVASAAVLDVAGGKGALSVQLALRGDIPCAVIDPLVRGKRNPSSSSSPHSRLIEQNIMCREVGTADPADQDRQDGMKHSTPVMLFEVGTKRDLRAMRKAGTPMPIHLAAPFHASNLDEAHPPPSRTLSASANANNTEMEMEMDDSALLTQMVRTATCLVALHPDECTEDVIDAALAHNKSVAVVPCCVFPDLCPERRQRLLPPNCRRRWARARNEAIGGNNEYATIDSDGDTEQIFGETNKDKTEEVSSKNSEDGKNEGEIIRTYEEFIDYLMAKDDTLKIARLPFRGKNMVIYRKVEL